MHTSIIYVTKKVIHWGANHPTEHYEKYKKWKNALNRDLD